MIFNMIAICPEETKDVLVSELKSLGATEIDPQFKAVHFKVDERGFYEAHLRLRTASRLLKIIKIFSAKDERMLFDQARRIPWADVLVSDSTFVIEGVPGERGEDVMPANTISKRIREALQAWFLHKEDKKPLVNLEDPDVALCAFVRGGKCILSVDTSGKSMHKRGYRSDRHPAPIKETLAAAVLKLLNYDGSVALYDPMCGSGTIAIEGCSMAMNKAALIHRKKGEFGFERLPFFNKELWREVQDSAREEKTTILSCPVFASDIETKFVEAARENALRARVERYISFSVGDFFDKPAPAPEGLLVANLPYGERLKTSGHEDSLAFYKAIGDKLKKDYSGWRAALLVPD
ncbi:MAG: THUMP domain-containing protein, partial [Proteobacteria bacterium]|nr:THUMP domain-containing protein [Pseudomonadota bacterium]